MRIIEPRYRANKPHVYRKRGRVHMLGMLLMLIVIVGIGVAVYQRYINNDSMTTAGAQDVQVTQSDNSAVETVADPNAPFKQFTGQEFKDLYYRVAYPNTQQIVEPLDITGNEAADKRIRELAEARGYVQTALPQNVIIKINEPRLNGDDLLQPLAASGWESLKQAAKTDNVPLSIVSAYRSPKWQRELFMERLLANGTNAEQIAAGIGDTAINATLSLAAVPGYSRHHTGYTIDLWCEDGSYAFATSSCYQWISKDNYLKAKQSGWIPGYPEGTDMQGPEPEPWEFVWVGTAVLK